MDIEAKKRHLIESFDILKDSWSTKEKALKKVLKQVYVMDVSLCFDMWIYVLNKNMEIIQGQNSWEAEKLTSQMLSYIIEEGCIINRDKQYKILSEINQNKVLRDILFMKNLSYESNTCESMAYLLDISDVETIESICSELLKNDLRLTDFHFSQIISTIIDDYVEYGEVAGCSELSDAKKELLGSFIEQIPNKEDRAEAFVSYLSLE